MRHFRRWQSWAVLAAAEAAVAAVALFAASAPSVAQFFDERFPFFNSRPTMPFFTPPRPAAPADNSHAPPPRKYDKSDSNLTNVLVMGDSMADWLAYGLETAFADTPDITVTRRNRTWSSLIFNPARHEFRSRNIDWPANAREVLTKEQPNFVVMMIGLSDRDPIRVPQPPAKPATPAAGAAATGAKPATAPAATPTPAPAPAAKAPAAPGADAPAQDAEQTPPAPGDAAAPRDDQPADQTVAADDKPAGGSYEFKTEKWTELYSKRIDETIAALKSKGVPVIWVGLPPIRGTKSMSEISFLNDLYRARADKAGIIYVDVWDGFVDEQGRYSVQGPDYEGQIRRLRSADGVHFTQAGARKLAHYVEKEIQRAMTHTGPVAIALPVEQAAPQAASPSPPGGGVTRPLAGPVVPLNAMIDSSSADELAGAESVRQSITDAVASRVLIRGEPVAAPAGRADDFVWPRRGVAPVGTDPVAVTTTLPMTPMVAERAALQGSAQASLTPAPGAGAGPAAPAQKRPRANNGAPRPPGAVAAREARRSMPPPPPSPFFFFFGGR